MGSRTVKNYPSPRLMANIGATNQSVPESIGELVANCFDARVGNEKVEVAVVLGDDKISVIDNCRGMTGDILEKAVCIAEDMSRHIERGEDAKGHFGMGFKAACSALGAYYEIFTRPVGEDTEYHVAFDINDYSRRDSGADAWDVVIEDGPVDGTGVLARVPHGSAFIISRLRNPDPMPGAIVRYLGAAFKGHLETGDRIVLVQGRDRTEIEPVSYKYLPGTKVDIDTACGPNGKYRITGWMALSDQTHNDGMYGFNIYRHGQLVMPWDKSWFKAHLMTSRIIGDVELGFIDSTFYKQGLQETPEWKLVSGYMKEYLKTLVAGSRHLSRSGNVHDAQEVRRVAESLAEQYGGESILPDDELTAPVEESTAADTAGINTTVRNVVTERSLELESGLTVNITIVNRGRGSDVNAPFDYIYEEGDDDGDPSALQVIVYEDHPLWKKKVSDEVRQVLAASDAIYRVLVEKLSVAPAEATRMRNDWVAVRCGMKGEE